MFLPQSEVDTKHHVVARGVIGFIYDAEYLVSLDVGKLEEIRPGNLTQLVLETDLLQDFVRGDAKRGSVCKRLFKNVNLLKHTRCFLPVRVDECHGLCRR